MQQRLRQAKKEALARSVGRAKGKRSLWDRLLRRAPRRDSVAAADMDFRDRGEDVWKALRY
jgi:hypothetical protein